MWRNRENRSTVSVCPNSTAREEISRDRVPGRSPGEAGRFQLRQSAADDTLPIVSGDQHVQQTFAGLKVSPIRLESFLSLVQGSICGGDRLTVTYLNPDYARRALRRESLRQDINEFDLVLVDGNGVRIMAPLFGFTVPERLDTDSVAPPLWQLLSTFKGKVFLFGCAPGVADDASRRLQDAFPGVQVVGTEHGFYDVQRGHPGTFSQEDTDLVIKRITAAEPDLLLVSLPTPMQQSWVVEHGHKLPVPVIMTGGCYLDHLAAGDAGNWYPAWVERWQLNWLYRLVHEPRRLWRRYSIEFLDFAVLVARNRISRSTPTNASRSESPSLRVVDQTSHSADLAD